MIQKVQEKKEKLQHLNFAEAFASTCYYMVLWFPTGTTWFPTNLPLKSNNDNDFNQNWDQFQSALGNYVSVLCFNILQYDGYTSIYSDILQ